MSWLGVNLNDSLQSIKGQLSNLTREVLNDDLPGYQDDGTEVVLSKEQLKELETRVQMHKHEVEELLKAKAELEERLHISDLHSAHQTSILRSQLASSQEELQTLRERVNEWGWNCDGPASPDANVQPAVKSTSKMYHPEKAQARIQELEKQVSQLHQNHQAEIAALQDEHQSQLAFLRSQLQSDYEQETAAKSVSVCPNCAYQQGNGSEKSVDVEAVDLVLPCPVSDKDGWVPASPGDWKHEREQLLAKIGHLENEHVQEVDGACLREECAQLKRENEELTKSLEELDQQHQAALGQVLQRKMQLQEELHEAVESNRKAEERFLEHQQAKDELEKERDLLSQKQKNSEREVTELKQLTQSFSYLESQLQHLNQQKELLTTELTALKENDENSRSQINELQQQLEKATHEKISACHKYREQENILAHVHTTLQKNLSCNFHLEKNDDDIKRLLSLDGNLGYIVSLILEFNERVIKEQMCSQEHMNEKELLNNEIGVQQLKFNDELRSKDEEISVLRMKLQEVLDSEEGNISTSTDKNLNEDSPMQVEQVTKELREKLWAEEERFQKLQVQHQNLLLQVDEQAAEEKIMQNTIQSLNDRLSELEKNMAIQGRQWEEESRKLYKAVSVLSPESFDSGQVIYSQVVETLKRLSDNQEYLENELAGALQDVKDAQDLVETLEGEKGELEKECEDLRDQLEELQCGERPQPEGSVTFHSLPTIEEEEPEGGDLKEDLQDNAETGEVACKPEIISRSQDKKKGSSSELVEGAVSNNCGAVNEKCQTRLVGGRITEEAAVDDEELIMRVGQLEAENMALCEARRNLELEVQNLQQMNESLETQLSKKDTEPVAESHTARAVYLTADSSTLTHEGDEKNDSDSFGRSDHMSDKPSSCNSVSGGGDDKSSELELCWQKLEEKEATIHVLEGEIEGLNKSLREKFNDKVALSCKQAEEMQRDLDTIQTQLIYKSDQLDHYQNGIKQICEIFNIESGDIRDVYVKIKHCYLTLNDNIKKGEKMLQESVEKSKFYLLNAEQCKMQFAEAQAEYATNLAEKDKELAILQMELSKARDDVSSLTEKVATLALEASIVDNLQVKIDELLDDQAEYTRLLRDKGAEIEELHKENSHLQELLANEQLSTASTQKSCEDMRMQLLQQISETEKKSREKENNLSEVINEKVSVMEQMETQIGTLKEKICELSQNRNEAFENERLSYTKQIADLTNLKGALEEQKQMESSKRLELLEVLECHSKEKQTLLDEKHKLELEKKEVLVEKEAAVCQIMKLQTEREEIITAIQKKHQESIAYHSEIQRLSSVLQQETHRFNSEREELQQKFSGSEAKLKSTLHTLQESQTRAESLQNQLSSSQELEEELHKSNTNCDSLRNEVFSLKAEVEQMHHLLSTAEQERNQLRIANSQFNSQYQGQNKELSALKERESRMSAECERLRLHLVEVEESYTAEAMRTSEREKTLRATLAKLEEKLHSHSALYSSASQRASVQVDSLLEQVRELTTQRDEAVQHLHSAEEAAEQNKQALNTLQQVLQDFQKSQARDIADATERERRKLEEEKKKSASLESQILNLRNQLAEMQSGLAAAARLGEQLQEKEQALALLQTQVRSHEQAMKRSQDEVAVLKSSSDVKIDKPLIRNLLVGYFATPSDKQKEVLHVIATILDFSPEERYRTGLDTHGTSWLTSIANFLAPPASNVQVASKVDVLDHTSLSRAFIRFLEEESMPCVPARLPAVQMAEKSQEKTNKKVQARAQVTNKMNPFVTTSEMLTKDTSSNSSSPLLVAATSVPSATVLPTFAPVSAPGTQVKSDDPTQSLPLSTAVSQPQDSVSSLTPSSMCDSLPLPSSSHISSTKLLSSLLSSTDSDKNIDSEH